MHSARKNGFTERICAHQRTVPTKCKETVRVVENGADYVCFEAIRACSTLKSLLEP